MAFQLDLLSIFPGHMSAQQQTVAANTLHQLVLEKHSLSDIVQIAQDHGGQNQTAIQAISTQAIKPNDIDSYRRLIRLLLFSMLEKAATVADFIDYAAQCRLKFQARDVPTSVLRLGPGYSPLRMSSGEMVSTKAINFISQNQSMMQLLMIHMVGLDDPDELQYLLTVPRLAKLYDPGQVSTWLSHFDGSMGPRLKERYFTTKGVPPESHQQFYTEMMAISNLRDESTPTPSVPAYARAIGHELIAELCMRNDKGAIRVMQKLIEDGADWFIGFEMKRLGRVAYYDLVGRQADFTAELDIVMQNAKRNDCKSLGFALIGALGEEPFRKLAYDRAAADRLWTQWRLPFVVEQVSERYQAEILASEIGL